MSRARPIHIKPILSGTSKPSGGSGFSCTHVGQYGQYVVCEKEWCWSRTREQCQALFEVSRAPLCQLPQYMAHYMTGVRQAASARFIELQEGDTK